MSSMAVKEKIMPFSTVCEPTTGSRDRQAARKPSPILSPGEVDQLTSIECIKFESNSNIALTNSFVDHGNSSIPANDDGSSSFIDITSVFSNGLNFFGQDFTGVYVNNNGNITFGSPLSTYTPGIIGGASSLAIIAPFWGDVDTRRRRFAGQVRPGCRARDVYGHMGKR